MKYKVGDKVRIQSIDWYNMHCDDAGNVDCGCEIFEKEMKPYLGKVFTIHQIVDNSKYEMEEAFDFFLFTDEMIEGLVEEECPQDFIEKYCISCGTQRCDRTKEFLDGCPYYNAYMCKKQNNDMGEEISLDKAGQIMDFEYEGLAYTLPEGYIFKDENGNVINATKIVLEKKKKEYPKTYEECCKVMNYCCNPVATKTTHKEELIRKFQFLLLYRDAYWKIAGEEMSLGKPWEPNWETLDKKYNIYNYRGVIYHDNFTVVDRCVLAFPTEEMRDGFYENFKEEINECKELL